MLFLACGMLADSCLCAGSGQRHEHRPHISVQGGYIRSLEIGRTMTQNDTDDINDTNAPSIGYQGDESGRREQEEKKKAEHQVTAGLLQLAYRKRAVVTEVCSPYMVLCIHGGAERERAPSR